MRAPRCLTKRCGPLLVLVAATTCGGNGNAAPATPIADASAIELSLLIVGDAGRPAEEGEPVLKALTTAAAVDPKRTLVLFLGDNVYADGLRPVGDPERATGERRLGAQVDVLRQSGAPGIFVPGNHDWRSGWRAVVDQQRFIETHGNGLASMVPGGGCPGPEIVDASASLRLVILDTAWWLFDGPKPMHPSSECEFDSEAEVLDATRRALADAGERHVVVVTHHPMDSGGRHGGHFAWHEHIFPLRGLHPWLWIPLPVLGSFYPLARMAGIADQDLTSDRYGSMRDRLRDVFRANPPLANVAGHDHNLQVLEGAVETYVLVSGAGIYGHATTVQQLEQTRFALNAAGFMRLDVLTDGTMRLAVLVVDETGGSREVFSTWLDDDERSASSGATDEKK
ncbi:MAG: metallophosphoesterase [Myxococcota bacterium]